MKKIILISLISLFPLFAVADTFIFNEIYYEVETVHTGSGVAYVSRNYSFSGVANIADTVEYNGRKYPVTGMIENAFRENKNLTGVTIPNTITTIGRNAFSRCENLTSVTMPNQLTSIGEGNFYGCKSLSNITIPYSVTSIGSSAFDYCENLLDVTCLAITPPRMVDYRCIYPAYYMATLHVPERSEEAYRATDWWNCFIDVVGDAEDYYPASYQKDECDANGDGEVNIADVNKVIDKILSK